MLSALANLTSIRYRPVSIREIIKENHYSLKLNKKYSLKMTILLHYITYLRPVKKGPSCLLVGSS